MEWPGQSRATPDADKLLGWKNAEEKWNGQSRDTPAVDKLLGLKNAEACPAN